MKLRHLILIFALIFIGISYWYIGSPPQVKGSQELLFDQVVGSVTAFDDFYTYKPFDFGWHIQDIISTIRERPLNVDDIDVYVESLEEIKAVVEKNAQFRLDDGSTTTVSAKEKEVIISYLDFRINLLKTEQTFKLSHMTVMGEVDDGFRCSHAPYINQSVDLMYETMITGYHSMSDLKSLIEQNKTLFEKLNISQDQLEELNASLRMEGESAVRKSRVFWNICGKDNEKLKNSSIPAPDDLFHYQ